jgi:predicted Rdx family selenoprotein
VFEGFSLGDFLDVQSMADSVPKFHIFEHRVTIWERKKTGKTPDNSPKNPQSE